MGGGEQIDLHRHTTSWTGLGFHIHRITILAIALSIGIAIGWNLDSRQFWIWFALATTLLLSGALVRRAFPALAMILLSAASTALGAGWVVLHQHYASSDDLAAMIA